MSTYAQFIANPTLAGFHPSLLLPINLFDRGAEPPVPPIGSRPPLYLDTETKPISRPTNSTQRCVLVRLTIACT